MDSETPIRWTVVLKVSRRGLAFRGLMFLAVPAVALVLGMLLYPNRQTTSLPRADVARMTGRNVPSILPVSLEKGWVSSEFGMRIHPITGKRRPHYGIDLAVDEGVPVKATADGKVIFAGDAGGYGNLVRIDHGNGIETRYAHNSALKVRAGERVRKGQVIALAGHSGLATGDHLHYEVRVDGKPVNPRDYLPPFAEGGRSKQ